MIFVRRANAWDADALAPLFDAYRQFHGQPADLATARGFLAARLSRRESVVFVAAATPDDAPFGFAQLYPSFSSVRARPTWILSDLYVAHVARGRGVARALLDRARSLAAQNAAAELIVEAHPENVAARALYEGFGFRQDHATAQYVYDCDAEASLPGAASRVGYGAIGSVGGQIRVG